jgi:hypothetical protein
MRYWKPEDIFTVPCPACGGEIEFWKDEPLRTCSSCGKEMRNPKVDFGCADWCKHGTNCLGSVSPQTPQAESSGQSHPKTS